MKRKVSTLPAIMFVLIFALLVVAGCQQADVEQSAAVEETKSKDAPATDAPATTDSADDGAEARAGGGTAVAKAGGAEARAGNSEARAAAGVNEPVEKKDKNEMKDKNREGAAGPDEVRVKIGGEPGTRFSGVCVVGGEEREVSGQVPGRFVYEPDGRKVECKIRKEGPDSGTLKFSVDAGGGNSKQKIKATADNLEFSVSGNSVSYSTSSTSSSSSSSSSVVQNSSVNSSSYSSSSSSSSSP